jgi:hypothetical protein
VLADFSRALIVSAILQMTPLNLLKKTFAATIISLLAGAGAFAQLPGGDGPPAFSAEMLKLFGNATAFTARADAQVFDKAKKELVRTPMSLAARDGSLRVEIDLAQLHTSQLTPTALVMLKQLGLDRVISVLRPDRKTLYLIYPSAKSFTTLPLPDDASAMDGKLKMQKTPLARETVDGHPCVKNNVRFTNAKGAVVLDAVTWNATDLKDFPVQIQLKDNDNSALLRLTQIQIGRLDAKWFEPAAGFTRYENPQALVVAQSKKALGAGGK